MMGFLDLCCQTYFAGHVKREMGDNVVNAFRDTPSFAIRFFLFLLVLLPPTVSALVTFTGNGLALRMALRVV